jgi:hypothetical protein
MPTANKSTLRKTEKKATRKPKRDCFVRPRVPNAALNQFVTHSVLEAFGAALIRHERKMPERCGAVTLYGCNWCTLPELDNDTAICRACGYLIGPADVPESPVAIPLPR